MIKVTDLYKPYENVRQFLVYGGAGDIPAGSLVMAGTAVGTLGAVIDATASAVDIVGLLTQLHDYSVVGDWTYNGTLTTAANRPMADVEISPFAVIQGEVIDGTTQTFDADNNGADTAISLGTAVGADDVLGGSWIYEGTVTGDLRFVEDHNATADVTLNTATSADWSAVAGAWVPQRLYGSKANQGLTPVDTQFKCEGNETVLWAEVLDHYVKRSDTNKLERLNPGIHDGLNIGLTSKVLIDIIIRDHAFNPLA